MAKCPKCNVELDWDNVIDIELRDMDEMANICQGSCPICKKHYQYTDVYKLDHVEDMVEIENLWYEED